MDSLDALLLSYQVNPGGRLPNNGSEKMNRDDSAAGESSVDKQDSVSGNALSSSSNWSWVAIAAALFSTVSVTLLLLGYGVAVAVENRFGVLRSSLFINTPDLFELSSIPVVVFLNEIPGSLDSLVGLLYRQAWPMLLVVCLFWILIAVIVPWIAARRGKKDPGPDQLIKTTRWFKRHKLKIKPLAVAIGIWGAPLLTAIAVFVALAILVIPLMVVSIGMSAADDYIQKFVINPKACVVYSLHGRANPEEMSASDKIPKSETKENGATCVVLEDSNGKEIARGRLVVSTTKSTVLLRADGVARRYENSTLTQYAVDDLPDWLNPVD